MAEKILKVKNLKMSFRTNSGILKAVRNISFDLYKGKTLAIVGESGSGKSVTSRAILGISAGNAIVEGGEILYDGMDLLKLSEEDIHSIRGDRISMIFQDPLSSLNPIVKIGDQITEAMLLKNKSGQKEAKDSFNNTLALLKGKMQAACPQDSAKIEEMCKTFDTFCIEANKLENSYNLSKTSAQSLDENIDNFLYLFDKKQKQDVKVLMKENKEHLFKITDEFFTEGYKEKLEEQKNKFTFAVKEYKFDKNHPEQVNESLVETLKNIKSLLNEMLKQDAPNFFRVGYYSLNHKDVNLHAMSVKELNDIALKELDNNFMKQFVSYTEEALKYTHENALQAKKDIIAPLKQATEFYKGEYTKKEALELAKSLSEQMTNTIDVLNLHKDSYAYTFKNSLESEIEKYFYYVVNNEKEEKRFAKQSAKRQALLNKGKSVDWVVVPKNVLDLDELKEDIVKIPERIANRYQEFIDMKMDTDYKTKAIELIDFFKEKASVAVYTVTKEMAKVKAIKLMEEVGIPEPRMRYYQYPFEFSGGMRQRIVIAIALSADPEILICDEPTTALDVTIQAQILELINKLKKERNLSIIFITHDLGVVAQMADDIAVMYAGKIVEYGTSDDIYYDPRHPYTWALLSSMPDLETKEKLESIPGTPPNMIYPPVGDAFAARNKYAMPIDFELEPPMFEISETHKAATWLLHPNAPKVEMPKIITERIKRMAGGAK